MQLEKQLQHAQCTFPFSYLGLLKTNNAFAITAWIPNATSIKVIDLVTDKAIGSLKRQAQSDLFTAEFTKGNPPAVYAFEVENAQGSYRIIDPYQFQDQAFHAVHFVDHLPKNVYQQLGAQLIDLEVGLKTPIAATRFAVFAPNASAVSVIGDFNYWDGSCLPMQKTDFGYWVLVVPGVKAGDKYKYQIKDAHGNELPHKADPVGFYAEQYPSHASVVFDHEQYQWQEDRKSTRLNSSHR